MDKYFFLALQGKLVVEISEMHAFSRAEKTSVKRVVSCPTDRFRAPFDRLTADHPRMCVFAGTTNREMFLADETGGRRFWPVKVGVRGRIQIARLKNDRDQLFAEAYSRYTKGDVWYKMPRQETAAVQESHRAEDAWEPLVEAWSRRSDQTGYSLAEVAKGAIGLDPDALDLGTQRRLADVLTVLDWTVQPTLRSGRQVRSWVPPPLSREPTQAQEPDYGDVPPSSTGTTCTVDTQPAASAPSEPTADHSGGNGAAPGSQPAAADQPAQAVATY